DARPGHYAHPADTECGKDLVRSEASAWLQQQWNRSQLLRDAVEILVPAQEDLVVDERRRRVEAVVQLVLGEHLERRAVADDERDAFAPGDVGAALRADGRREDIRDAVETLKLVMRCAGLCVDGGENP